MPTSKKWVLPIAVATLSAAGAWFYINRRLFLVNDITTGGSVAYPELRSRIYLGTLESVSDAAESALASLAKWRLIFNDQEKNVLVAEVEAPIGGFLSEVTLSLSEVGPRHVRTTIRSLSKAGRGDLGENARNIRQAQEAMDLLLVGR